MHAKGSPVRLFAGLFWGAHLIHDPQTMMASAQQLVRWWLDGAIRPHATDLPRLYVAGEAFSSYQAWMEGALETAELALTAFAEDAAFRSKAVVC